MLLITNLFVFGALCFEYIKLEAVHLKIAANVLTVMLFFYDDGSWQDMESPGLLEAIEK